MVPIVYHYPCRWDQAPPARHRYLMEAASALVPVYFLNWPRLTDSYADLKMPRLERVTPNVTVVHDAFGVRLARGAKRTGRLGAILDAAMLHRLLRADGVQDYVYWLATASTRMLWSMRTDRLVYDCIDPCFDPAAQDEFDREEFGVASKAKVVFASAESLVERLRRVNDNSHLLPNACSPGEYEPAALRALARPAGLQGRTGKVVGYMGTFDARVDMDVLLAAARALPDVTFALVGRINQDQEARVAALRRLPNVVLTGAVSVEEGRAYVAAFDVGLVPFIPGDMGDGINPVKMHMYLMAGKPVVSTWIRECRKHAPLVAAAQNTNEFVAAVRAALDSDPSEAARRTDFGRRNSWAVRAAEAVAVLRNHGLLDADLVPAQPVFA